MTENWSLIRRVEAPLFAVKYPVLPDHCCDPETIVRILPNKEKEVPYIEANPYGVVYEVAPLTYELKSYVAVEFVT